MPRERVQHGELFLWPIELDVAPGELPGASGQHFDPSRPQPEGTVIREEPSLDVIWNREGEWVQIGFEAPRDWWDRFIQSYESSPELHHLSVFTNVLDRRQINNLIKALRRARDAAYGADE